MYTLVLLELLRCQELSPALLKGVKGESHDTRHRPGCPAPFGLAQLMKHPYQPLRTELLHNKIDRGRCLGVGELHLIGGIELHQGRVHVFEAHKALVLEGMGQQALRTAVEPGPWRQAPRRLKVFRNTLMQPDRGVIVAEMHHNVMNVLVAQRICPAISARQVAWRQQHDLIELADTNRTGNFDITGREARGRVKRRRGRKDFDADLLCGCETKQGRPNAGNSVPAPPQRTA